MLELAVAALLLFIVHWLMKRRDHFNFFKKCGIPGPPPNIIFGNILEMYKKSPTKAYREWIEKYGDVVGYFNGYRPVVLVADLDLLRNIQVKDFQDFTDRALLFQAKRPGQSSEQGPSAAHLDALERSSQRAHSFLHYEQTENDVSGRHLGCGEAGLQGGPQGGNRRRVRGWRDVRRPCVGRDLQERHGHRLQPAGPATSRLSHLLPNAVRMRLLLHCCYS
ncbi:hypothetical protein MRX96_026376 [Rhipicephalus microplus]